MTPHRQLLADYAQAGSEDAFRELVASYIGLVHGSALRLVNGNTQLAEDITQLVFTDLARKAKSLSPEVMVGGWLHRRACYAAATALRSERRRLVRETEALEMNALQADNSDEALARVAPLLDEAINQLTAEDRDAITLRFFERWNFRAVGEALGTSEAAAQKRVERALEKLRGLLARRGVALSATALALAIGSASATAAPAGLAVAVSTTALSAVPASAGFSLTTLKIMALTKLKITLIAVAVAAIAAGTTTTIVLNRDPSYTPPANPDPQKILSEAQEDTAAGRYKDALAKHIWYRDNALKYEPAQRGVRNSFALSYWADLAQKYPPAKKKLLSIRADAEKEMHKNTDAKFAATAFLTVDGINRSLKEDSKNIALFKWLDAHNPDVARRVYMVAEGTLIDAKEFELCGRYIDPDKAFAQILLSYNTLKKLAKKDSQTAEFAVKNFTMQCARLVAVLANINRNDDAARIAGQATREIKTPEFSALLVDAKNGQVPPKWY